MLGLKIVFYNFKMVLMFRQRHTESADPSLAEDKVRTWSAPLTSPFAP